MSTPTPDHNKGDGSARGDDLDRALRELINQESGDRGSSEDAVGEGHDVELREDMTRLAG